MKKILPIIIVLLGLIAFIKEYSDNFTKTKILYATFNSKKYFEKDELNYNQKISSAGSGGRGFYLYKGFLVNNLTSKHVFGDEKQIEKLILTNGNIPIWFCKITGADDVLIRKNNILPKPYSKYNINSWLYILMWIISLKYIHKILKKTIAA